MTSALEELQKDLEEVKVLLEKSTRKRLRDTLTSEKSKIETELKNKMQQKSQKKPELDNEKPAAVVAPLTTGYTVKISNYGMTHSIISSVLTSRNDYSIIYSCYIHFFV